MARIPVKFMELHSTLFLASKQFPEKVDPAMISGLSIEYDEETNFIFMSFRGNVAKVPMTNVKYFLEGEAPKRIETTVVEHPKPRVTAQVSGPTHHVHQGPGHGRTSKE